MINFVKNGVSVILIVLSLVAFGLCQNTNSRLSNATYPIEYKIWLYTQMDLIAQFDGKVVIRIGVNTPTDKIILNAFLKQCDTVELFVIDGDTEIQVEVQVELSRNMLVVQSEQQLVQEKEYILIISYVGTYQTEARGMYRSVFSDDGPTTVLATNFVPQYASYVFPCYDEPTFRAIFTLSIEYAVGYHVISNMDPLENRTDDATRMITTTFRTTPILSIHSLNFVVVNYESICIETDLKICVYYDEQHTSADVELVLETAKNSIVELNNYLGIALGMPKLDIIPVTTLYYPHYTSGSYGILINNQKYFYFNATISGLLHKDEIIRHTIRQVTNIYFGNSLIPEWWNDVWLTQGLSVLFEYMVEDKLYPEFDAMNQFLSTLYDVGFTNSAVKPTDSDTLTPELLVDNGIGHKSAGILYMFKNIVGEDIFKTGLQSILSDGPVLVNSETFFNIFTRLAIDGSMIPNHYDLNIIMNTWLTQLRYPMVGITRTYLPLTDTTMRIYQKDIINVYGEDYNIMNWWIPYDCVSQFDSTSAWTKTSPSKWLENISEENVDHGFGTKLDVDSWMLCNKEQSGFYYINYDPNNYKLLAHQLYRDHKTIPALTRAQLVHVGFLTAQLQYNSFSLIFQLCNYIHREDTYTPVNICFTEFNKFASQIYGTEPYENVTKFIAHKIGPAYDRVRLTQLNIETKGLSFNDEKLCEIILFMACRADYNNCLEDMNKLLIEASNGNGASEFIESLSINEFADYILHYGMVLADEILFLKMVGIVNEFNKLATALAFVHDSKLLDDLFTILQTQNGEKIYGIQINIAGYYRAYILGQIIRFNLPALDKTYDFMIEKSTIIKEILGDEYVVVVIDLSESTKTKERLEKLREIVELYKTPTRNFEEEFKMAEKNVEWCSSRIKEFQETLSEILEHIDDDEQDDGAATISAVSIVLLFSLLLGGQLI